MSIDRGSDYQDEAGQPRYGVRNIQLTSPAGGKSEPPAKTASQEAAELTMEELFLAARVRRYRSWAREPHPLTAELTAEHPAEFRIACALVEEDMGTEKDWNRQLIRGAGEKRSSAWKVTGKDVGIVFLFLLAIVLLPAGLAVLLFATDIATAPAVALILVVLGLISQLSKTAMAVMKPPYSMRLTAEDRKDLRRDVAHATLVDVLESKDIDVSPAAAKAASAGFRDLQSAAVAVRSLRL